MQAGQSARQVAPCTPVVRRTGPDERRSDSMQKITPCLWFDGQAEEAARFYVSLFPGSRIERVLRSPTDTPGGPAGMVLTVDFTLAGTRYIGLNGGPGFPFTQAVSFMIECEDQAEV